MRGLVQIIEDICIAAGNAHARSRQPRCEASAGDGFLVGQDVEEGIPIVVTQDDLARHLYITGATGSGKTNLLLRLVDHLVASGETICLIDLRGDLVDLVLGRLASCGEDVPERARIIDLRDQRLIAPLNPLGGAGSIHSRAYGVLGALKANAESWGVQLDEALRNCLVALAQTGGTLVDLPALLSSRPLRTEVVPKVSDPMALEFFERFEAMSSQSQAMLVSPVLNKVTPFLAMPELRQLLSGSPGFDLSGFLNQRASILLVALAGHHLKEAARLAGSLILASIEHIVVSRAERSESERVPLYLIVDEFENFASASFLTLLAEGRRYGCRLVLAHQNLSQLSKEMQEGLRSNAHLQLYFQTGASDAAALSKEVSGLGKKEQVQELLKTLPVGSALFTSRSEPTVVLATPKVQLVAASLERLARLTEASMAGYARDRCRASQALPNSSKEVRHARKPKL